MRRTHTLCVLFSMTTAVDTAPWSWSAPPRVEVVLGLVGQDNFVPSKRFREDGLEDLKLSTGRGGARYTLGAPAVAKRTKPINSLHPKRKKNNADFGGHVARFMLYTFFFTGHFHGQNTARGGRFYLVLVFN